MRNGKTVEVLNTDAEGRLVMADGLCLAVEDGVDAVVDIATLTGACLRTFGVDVAGVMGNDAGLVDQLEARRGRPPTSPCGSSRCTGPTARSSSLPSRT